MSQRKLKAQLIRLGEQRPKLRNHLRPVLSFLDTKVASLKRLKRAFVSAVADLGIADDGVELLDVEVDDVQSKDTLRYRFKPDSYEIKKVEGVLESETIEDQLEPLDEPKENISIRFIVHMEDGRHLSGFSGYTSTPGRVDERKMKDSVKKAWRHAMRQK